MHTLKNSTVTRHLIIKESCLENNFCKLGFLELVLKKGIAQYDNSASVSRCGASCLFTIQHNVTVDTGDNVI